MSYEVTPLMLKAAWNVARQFWPAKVVEMRPCKKCGQVKGLRVVETCHKLTEPLPGFREAILAAFEASPADGAALNPDKGQAPQ